jgi:protein SCO1/2
MSALSRRDMLGMLGMAPLAGGVTQSFAADSLAPAPAAAKAQAQSAQTQSAKARRRIQEQHLPNVPLITHEGKRVLFYDDLVKNKKVSMNFFYANCDEICPLVMANLAKVQRLLANHVDRSFQMYSFTLKPDEDTVEVIREHRRALDAKPGWTFLTGKPQDMETLRAAIGFKYPDPAIDKDKTQHIGNIRYGNEPLMLWSACPGMAHADWIAETLQWMIHPQVDRVQKS